MNMYEYTYIDKHKRQIPHRKRPWGRQILTVLQYGIQKS